jgi:hypothetical protein
MRTLATALATAIIATSTAWKAEAAMVSGVGELPLTKAHSVIERVGSYSRAYGYGYGYVPVIRHLCL